MTQAAKRRLRFGSEARDLVCRQVTGNAFERRSVKQAPMMMNLPVRANDTRTSQLPPSRTRRANATIAPYAIRWPLT
jgi:hypothetical protein